jgi:hypothetical protein
VSILVCCCWYEPERVCCGACVVGMLAIEFCVCLFKELSVTSEEFEKM